MENSRQVDHITEEVQPLLGKEDAELLQLLSELLLLLVVRDGLVAGELVSYLFDLLLKVIDFDNCAYDIK